MHTYTATVLWTRPPDAPFKDNKYSRAHEWRFDGGAVVPASSSPLSVRVPFSMLGNDDGSLDVVADSYSQTEPTDVVPNSGHLRVEP